MYDTIDTQKAGALKDIDSTASDSIYTHKDSVTVNAGGPCQYVKAPEFQDTVIINSSIYSPVRAAYKYPWKYTEVERPCGQYGKCYDCGMPYGEFPDMVLPDDLWELINPSQHKGSGLLCPTCIANRLDYIGKWYELRFFCSPFGANPDHIKLALVASETVLKTMKEGEKSHGKDEWKKQTIEDHREHAMNHIGNSIFINETEDHIAHALTRCAMIKYLEAK